MISILTLDYIWKIVFTFLIVSSFFYLLALAINLFVKKYSTSEKSKWFINYHSVFLVLTLLFIPFLLASLDPEIAASCFSRFASDANSYSITRVLSAFYIFGLLIVIFLDVIKFGLFKIQSRKFKEIKSHTINISVKEIMHQLNKQLNVPIVLNLKAQSPFVFGLFKYKLVVNKDILESSDLRYIKSILSHELMHIKDKDAFWLLLSHVAKRILFFNPLAYLYFSQHRLIAEMAADEMAVQNCNIDPKVFLNAILKIATGCAKNESGLLRLNATQGFRELNQRVLAMSNRKRANRKWLFPALTLTSLIFSVSFFSFYVQANIKNQKNINGDLEIMMCSQVRHEMALESWLRIHTVENKCE